MSEEQIEIEIEEVAQAADEQHPLARTVFLVGPITEELLSRVGPVLFYLDSTEGDINIVLASLGGEVMSGMAIFGILQQLRNKIVMVGYGPVQSMAAVLLQAADVRILQESARFMIHDGSVGGGEGREDLHTHLAQAAEIQRINKWCNSRIAKRSKVPLKKVQEISRKETYLSATEAVKLGFADKVLRKRRRK